MSISSYTTQDLSTEEQLMLEQEFRKHKKSTWVAYVLWVFGGLYYGYLNRWKMQILHWVTLGGFGLWRFVDLFRIPSMVSQANQDKEVDIFSQILAMRKSTAIMTWPGERGDEAMPELNKRQLADLERERRRVLEGLNKIGVEASLDEDSGTIKLQRQEIDGVMVFHRIMDPGAVEPIMVYYVIPAGQQPFAESGWTVEFPLTVEEAPLTMVLTLVSIHRKKSFPVFGKVTGLRFSVHKEEIDDERFANLCSQLQQDWGLHDLLLEVANKWRSIEITPIMAEELIWQQITESIQDPEAVRKALGDSIVALGIQRRSGVPSRELFDCYNRIGRHMRQALKKASRQQSISSTQIPS